MKGNFHVRCEVGENQEMTSNDYLSLYSDGGHILLLIITLLYKFFRPLIENGHVYVPKLPLYKAVKYKNGQPIIKWFGSENEIAAERQQLRDEGYQISRFKGLGEMDPEEVGHFTTDRENRTLYQLAIDDAEAVAETLNILMGDSAELRKDWVSEHIDYDELMNSL